MKKEDLLALGLTEEQVAEVQKLNGIDIGKEQKKYTDIEVERDNYKSQLDIANDALKNFEGVDLDKLNGELAKLKSDLETKDKEFQTQLFERDFTSKLEEKISALGGKNSKAVKAMIDIEALKASKNQDSDIELALQACKNENNWLFGADEPINKPVQPTKGIPSEDKSYNDLARAMGLTESDIKK